MMDADAASRAAVKWFYLDSDRQHTGPCDSTTIQGMLLISTFAAQAPSVLEKLTSSLARGSDIVSITRALLFIKVAALKAYPSWHSCNALTIERCLVQYELGACL